MSNRFNKTINITCLYFILAWYLVPILTSRLGTIMVVFLYILWFASSNLTSLRRSLTRMTSFFLWYFYMLFLLFVGLYDGVAPIYFFTMTLLFALPAVLYSYYTSAEDLINISTVKHAVVLFFLIGGLNTIYVLAAYPMAAKILAMGDSVATLKARYEAMGCGGYNYVYSFALLLLPMLLSIRNEARIWKFFTATTMVINVIVLLMSQYIIAVILVLLSFIIYLVTKLFSGSKTGFLLGVILLILLGFGVVFLPQIFLWLAKVTTASEGMSQRFTEMAAYMMTGDAGYNLGGRLDRYSWSWNIFLQHPLLGAQYFGGGTYGQHSSILDQLARYGLVGTIGYVAFIIRRYRYQVIGNNKRVILTSVLVFSIFSFLNPTIYIFQVGMILLCVIPFISNQGKRDFAEGE